MVLGLLASVHLLQAQGGMDSLIQPRPVMKVEIWSDVMCPFCYIGKRKFEAALANFPQGDLVEVEWKSFQLNPNQVTDPSLNTVAHLAASKGWSLDYAKQMSDGVTRMAAEVGLKYDFERAVVANSFDAHRLSHYAKSKGKGDAFEERLFRAYFVEGRNTADHTVLAGLAAEVGLPEADALAVLGSTAFADAVQADIATARQIGVQGVPFFVIDRRYAVSGAQQPEVFLGALEKAWEEGGHQRPLFQGEVIGGPACKPDGSCD
jgi:predicted DsbA family dithiol-disulfide isomerase